MNRATRYCVIVAVIAFVAFLGLLVGSGRTVTPASAQTAPPGYYYCNGALILSSQTCTNAGAPVGTYLCNGAYIPTSTPCSSSGTYLCNGTYIPTSQPCTTGTPTYLCNGTYIPASIPCTVATPGTYLCNGVYIPTSTPCSSTATYLCNGTYIPTTQACTSLGAPPPPPPPVPTPAPAPTPSPPCSVSYSTGWNLVGGPTGTVLSGVIGTPIYTLQASDAAYEQLAAGTPLQSGEGYWAYFSAATTITLPCVIPLPTSVQLPTNQWIMVGNPFNVPAFVTGADFVFTYSPSSGYSSRSISALGVGGGAWVFSSHAGTLTLTPCSDVEQGKCAAN